MEKKFHTITIDIQSYNNVITNSSSEVVVRYSKDGVLALKSIVNELIKPFTSLRFDDLFNLYYIYENPNTCDYEELSEDVENLDKILDESWENTYDGGYPSVIGIKVVSKEGKGLENAANLLERVANIFETSVVYG